MAAHYLHSLSQAKSGDTVVTQEGAPQDKLNNPLDICYDVLCENAYFQVLLLSRAKPYSQISSLLLNFLIGKLSSQIKVHSLEISVACMKSLVLRKLINTKFLMHTKVLIFILNFLTWLILICSLQFPVNLCIFT